MNDNLNTDNYYYQVNQLHQQDIMRAVDQQRLARVASSASETHAELLAGLIRSVRQFFSHQKHFTHRGYAPRRHIQGMVAMTVIVSVMLASTFTSQAQSIVDPGQPEPRAELVHYGVGMYFQAHGNHERALQEFTLAIEALPQVAASYTARADSYMSLKQYALAITDYTEALRLNGDDALTCAKRAFAFAAHGDLDAAQLDFERVISMNSASPS